MQTAVLASTDFSNPLLWAVLIGWIMSVVVHEFAHGLVGHLGGDYTVRERGGLSLNPLQYIDPIMSLLIPAIILAMGGIPLPGGATYVQEDLLRSKGWMVAVALAGPASNLLLFFLLAIAVHPRVGWVDYSANVADWSSGQKVAASLAVLQLFSVFLNLLPIPPLDGFNAVSAYMDPAKRDAARRQGFFLGIFGIYMLFKIDAVRVAFFTGVLNVLQTIGYSQDQAIDTFRALGMTLRT